MTRQRGMTLLELLLAMALGVFLLATLIQVYLGSKQSYRTTTALARVQENGRFAVDELSFDLRMTGFQGCADAGTGPNNNRVVGYETGSSGWAPSALTALEAEVVAGTDVVTSSNASSGLAITNLSTAAANTQVTTADNPEGVAAGESVIVSGCNGAFTTTVTGVAVDGGTGITTFTLGDDLSDAYLGANLQLMRAESVTYFVSAQGLMRRLGANSERVIDGVDNMQLLYGRASAGTPPRVSYLPANLIDFANDRIVGVRIGLLLSSPEPATDQADTRRYRLLDQTVGPAGSGTAITYPNDRRLRQAFTTTVNLRNLD